jgi:hypothetical protein
MRCQTVQLPAAFARHDFLFPPSKLEPHPADVQRDLDDLDSDQVILAALEDSLFVSVRQLSRLTHLPSMIVYRRLTQSLGFVARYL